VTITSLLTLLIGCSNRPENGLEYAEINLSFCAKDAVQLIKPVYCFKQPTSDNPCFVILEDGLFVYLCRKHNKWLAVMYPRTGEAIDCNYRSTNQKCQTGWIIKDV